MLCMARAGSVAVLVLLGSISLAFGQQQVLPTPPSPPTSGYIGSNVCRACHPTIWQTFYKNPHFRSVASGKEPPERTGCEGCHGPAKAHVAAGGGKDTIPHAFSVMGPNQVLDDCLGCHAKDFTKANIRRSDHTQNDVVCTNCHSIHSSPTQKYLLAKQQRDLCYTCHTTVRAQFDMPFKHRVNEGFMECTDCHNPHGAFAPTWAMGQKPRMVLQVLDNEEACLKCHMDKRGPLPKLTTLRYMPTSPSTWANR